ncbi:MAG TPA: SAF domain-containing protein [Acidothermaceae bacterium]
MRRRRDAGAALAWVPLRPTPPPLRDAPSLRPPRRTVEHVWREIRIGARRYRQLLRAALVTIALALVVARLAPKPPATIAVVAAARDLPIGEVLTAADLHTVNLPPATVPSGVATDVGAVVGSQLSGPLRRNEPLTDVRLGGGVLRRPGSGLVSAPVRLADSQAALLLQPGQRIDVLAANTDTGGGSAPVAGAGNPAGVAGPVVGAAATVVAADVMVVAIPIASAPPGATSDATGDVGAEGTLVVLATTVIQARQLAQAQVSSRLSAVVVG